MRRGCSRSYAKGFVRPDTTTAEEGFRFHHALIRDAAYDGISEEHTRRSPRAASPSGSRRRRPTTRWSATTSSRPASSAVSSAARTPSSATRAGRAAPGARARRRSAQPTCRRRSRCSSGRGRCFPTTRRLELLPELGEALFEAGRLAEADDVLSRGDRAGGVRLRCSRLARASSSSSFGARRGSRPERGGAGGRAKPLAGLRGARRRPRLSAGLRSSGAWIDWNEGHATAADEAWQRAATHARAAGRAAGAVRDPRLARVGRLRGPAAGDGGDPDLQRDPRARCATEPVAVAVTLHPLAALHAMRGEFDQARSLIREGNAILDEAGRMQSAVSHHEALVEMLAGNPAAAEERLRTGYERLEEMGEKALLATTAAMLAEAVYAQGRYEEAETFCAVSQATADPEDLVTQMIWRGVRAKLLARRGRLRRRRGTRPARRSSSQLAQISSPTTATRSSTSPRSSASQASPTRRTRRFGPGSSSTHARETSFRPNAPGHSWRCPRDSPLNEPLEVTKCQRQAEISTRCSSSTRAGNSSSRGRSLRMPQI